MTALMLGKHMLKKDRLHQTEDVQLSQPEEMWFCSHLFLLFSMSYFLLLISSRTIYKYMECLQNLTNLLRQIYAIIHGLNYFRCSLNLEHQSGTWKSYTMLFKEV